MGGGKGWEEGEKEGEGQGKGGGRGTCSKVLGGIDAPGCGLNSASLLVAERETIINYLSSTSGFFLFLHFLVVGSVR